MTITVRSTGHKVWLTASTAGQSNRRPPQTILIPEAYEPLAVVMPQWRVGGAPVLLLTFQIGADYEVLEVFDVSRRRLRLMQRFDANALDIARDFAKDGNGDIHLFDGLPPAFRCLWWADDRPGFVQHPCKTLPHGSQPPD